MDSVSNQRPWGPAEVAWGDQPPLAYPAAARALAGCAVRVVGLLCRRRMHLPDRWVRTRLRFADGSAAPVYRETAIDYGDATGRCVLVVTFTLRWVHGWGHALFRAESLLNTVLFAGFPGLVSKLWLANDERERYRGVYEWDGPERADQYARALWRVLALVSVPGSIHYVVLPGLSRDDFLREQREPGEPAPGEAAWWRVVEHA
jgi:hypothetical protein